MPKHSFALGASAAKSEFEGGGFYDGPVPPVGVYTVTIKFVRIKVNKNKDDMLNVLVEISETDAKKKKYNGYGIWNNLNVTDQGAPYINAFLDAIGAKRAQFWGEGVVTDDNEPPNILRIGTKRLDGLQMRVATKLETYDGTEKLVPSKYMPLKDEDADDDGDAGDDGDEGNEADDAIESVDPEEGEEAAEEESEAGEGYSEAELKAMSLDELKELATEWECEFSVKEGKSKVAMVKALVAFQEEEEAPEEEAAEEEAEEEPAEEGPEQDALTEEELTELETDELKELLTDQFGGTLPRPPVKSRLIKAILEAQAAQAESDDDTPPF